MKIKLLKDCSGHREYKAGEMLDYEPWPHEWRSMSEPERVAKGIYVYCFGHGEFDVLEAEPITVMYFPNDQPMDQRLMKSKYEK